jgi:HK97 gp10 family phage protein
MPTQFVRGKPVGQSSGFQGQREVIEKLKEIMNETTAREVKQVYYEAGTILRDQARANAPRSKTRTKGTHLADAIFVDMGRDDDPNVLVGVRYSPNGAPHAHLVEYGRQLKNAEFGSEKVAARPYFRPAISQTIPLITQKIKDGLLAVIAKAVK